VNGEFEGPEGDTKYDTHEEKRLQYSGPIFESFIVIVRKFIYLLIHPSIHSSIYLPIYLFIYLDRDMAPAVSRWPLTAEARVRLV
jgi:hypothetical protein